MLLVIRLMAFVQEGRFVLPNADTCFRGRGFTLWPQLKVFCVSWTVVGTISLYTGAANESVVITGELNSTQLAFREHVGL